MTATLQGGREGKVLEEKVLIIEPASLNGEQEAISKGLLDKLSANGISAERAPWTTDLSSCHGRLCIVLMELASPFLDSITEEEFHSFKKLVEVAGSILWVTKGDDPKMDIILGLSRTIRNEMNGLKFRVLQIIDDGKRETSELVRQIWGVAECDGKDLEFVLQDGVVNIARLTEEVDMNEMIADQARKALPKLMAIGKSHSPVKLEIGVPGMLDTLYFVEDTKGAEELEIEGVEISVKATGLK